MFDPSPTPRLFCQEPGADFATALARGLHDRMAGQPPEAMARVEILLNTERMRGLLRAALIDRGPGFLPRLRLITDLGAEGPASVSPLRRRLELAQLVRGLIAADPTLAPRRAAFALADSLAALLDEMQTEGVPIDRLKRLDVANHSDHWQRSLDFIQLVAGFLEGGQPGDPALRQRRAVETLIAQWAQTPPSHPVILAGSTGSRGVTALLMQAVARLPQGAVVLPGFDTDMPAAVWEGLEDPLLSEDHPQYRFHRLLRALDLSADQVALWAGASAPDPARNRLVSLALRPAPVTDRWLLEGPTLGDLVDATAAVTLIEAPNPRAEAQAIALCLRQAALEGQKAALITPDRTLARQVTAALDRWHLRPDDSAGRPLGLSAPGRFLRQTAGLLAGDCSAESLIALLKHPLTHSAAGRGDHLRHLRELELWLRRKGVPYPDHHSLAQWPGLKGANRDWPDWLASLLARIDGDDPAPLEDWLTRHLALSEALACGAHGTGSGELWLAEAGKEAQALFSELQAQAAFGGTLTQNDYSAMLETILTGRQVREVAQAHPDIAIWGTLEARAQGADLVILAGLNDGVWPAAPQPDPWLNRRMRLDAGLLLPDRQIGLAAHDFQQAIGARRVVLSRSIRDAEAETIPSRWLNRLKNLIKGLPDQRGPEALEHMRERGQHWLTLVARFEQDFAHLDAGLIRRNPRPAPAPPAPTRPRELPVTAIKTLIRDPYHIYARYVLGLRRLDPLAPEPDARLRGTVLHRVIETFSALHPPGSKVGKDIFLACAETVLAAEVPWQAARLFWLARLSGVADAYLFWHAEAEGRPVLTEKGGGWNLGDPTFRLIGRPDRIDLMPDGRLHLIDFKTGAPPTSSQQAHFDKQLVLLALMAEAGAFPGLAPMPVSGADFVGLGPGFSVVKADVSAEALARHDAQLRGLLRAYLDPAQGFTARRALKSDADHAEYDQLSRLGEWQVTDEAARIEVGDHE